MNQPPGAHMVELNDLLFSARIDNMNLFKVDKYFQRSEVIKKVNWTRSLSHWKVNGFCSDYSLQLNTDHAFSSPRKPINASNNNKQQQDSSGVSLCDVVLWLIFS